MSDDGTPAAAAGAVFRHVRGGRPGAFADPPLVMVLGPQRTGTNWVHARCAEHPDLRTTFTKETYFFSAMAGGRSGPFRTRHVNSFRRDFLEPPWVAIAKARRARRHFGRGRRVAARVTTNASDAALPEDLIDEAVLLAPTLRAVLILRDPVERAWSHAKLHFERHRKRPMARLGREDLFAFFEEPYLRRVADYAGMAARWRSRLPEGRLTVMKFEDIAARPFEFLRRFCDVAGVRFDERVFSGEVGRPRHATRRLDAPDDVVDFLVGLLGEDLERTDRTFGTDFAMRYGR